ncbi:VOC family protein [Rhodococcus sp. JVH1]|uniref:VOC family protein n=1 Tax=Rhodococcus sp. JVH1 TaxID=745408 RepID=UPI0005C1D34F|nr:VOC family protein [Rhodococcus sp. JVH1]
MTVSDTPRSNTLTMRAQPLLAVDDVERAGEWYRKVLDARRGHGGRDYEQLLVDGHMILQLHRLDEGHHHGPLGDPSLPRGNGVAIWFETPDFDGTVARVREAGADVVMDVHVNPNAGHREIWIRDLDGYLVVFAEPA